MKAYIVYEYQITWDDSFPIAVFLDEQKCDEFIKEKNKAWEEDHKKYEECCKCRNGDSWGYHNNEDDVFLLKDSCDRAKIEKDRHGLYCENEINYYGIESKHYTKTVVDLIE